MVLFVVLDALDSVRVAWLASTAALELCHQLSGLLVVNRNALVVSCGCELLAVWSEVHSQDLEVVYFVLYCVQLLPARCVPVGQGAVGAKSYDDILGYARRADGPPLDVRDRHGDFHTLVEHVRLLSREDVVDLYGSVLAARRNVLIVKVELHGEGGHGGVAQEELLGHPDGSALCSNYFVVLLDRGVVGLVCQCVHHR